MEEKIVEYLRQKYSPQVIALSGSRATGKNDEKSDWDLFLFCKDDQAGGFYQWNDQLLDITLRDWPKKEDWVFTTPYAPVWPVKVLFDDTNGEFDKILKNTKEAYDKGPLVMYAAGCEERLQKLDRWLGKIQKFQNNPEVQFYYAGYIDEFLVRVWFEQQNLWPLPPDQAFTYIKGKDAAFFDLLSQFTKVKGADLAVLTEEIVRQLRLLKK